MLTRQGAAFFVVDSEGREVIRVAVSIDVQAGEAAAHVGDRHDEAVVFGDPLTDLTVVGSHGNRRAYRHAEEVGDVHGHRSIEEHVFAGANAELDGVGVGARGREGGDHALGAAFAHGEFAGTDLERSHRRHGAVGGANAGARSSGKEDRRGARSVGIFADCAPDDAALTQVDGGGRCDLQHL